MSQENQKKGLLGDTLEFLEFTRAFARVERTVTDPVGGAKENDAQHSFQLAIVAWYLNSRHDLGLDTDKLLRYALVHDLVEVYAGDTPFHSSDENLISSQDDREKDARQEIAEKFPHFSDLHKNIREFELGLDKENLFLQALDKLLPTLNIYMDDGYTWRLFSISLEDIVEKKKSHVSKHALIEDIFEELVVDLRNNHGAFFDAKD